MNDDEAWDIDDSGNWYCASTIECLSGPDKGKCMNTCSCPDENPRASSGDDGWYCNLGKWECMNYCDVGGCMKDCCANSPGGGNWSCSGGIWNCTGTETKNKYCCITESESEECCSAFLGVIGRWDKNGKCCSSDTYDSDNDICCEIGNESAACCERNSGTWDGSSCNW